MARETLHPVEVLNRHTDETYSYAVAGTQKKALVSAAREIRGQPKVASVGKKTMSYCPVYDSFTIWTIKYKGATPRRQFKLERELTQVIRDDDADNAPA